MTEFITKEEAKAIYENMPECLTVSEIVHRAINLAFEQKLEVVGWTTSDEIKEHRRAQFFPGMEPEKLANLYALKGDSK